MRAAYLGSLVLGFVAMASSADASISLSMGATSVSSNSPATGVSASILMTFTDVTSGPNTGQVLLALGVRNTTGEVTPFGSGATDSMLTGFGFDLVAGATYVSNSFSAGTYLDTLIQDADFNPFGTLTIAAADNDNFLGGDANGALPEKTSDSLSMRFNYTGTVTAPDTKASALEKAFLNAFQANPPLQFGSRFQQVNGGSLTEEGSDKLNGGSVSGRVGPEEIVPEPISVASWLGLMGVGGLVARRRRAAR